MKTSLWAALAGLTLASSFAVADDCNPSSIRSCSLPFPSDIWAETDLTSPTGKRLNVPDAIFPDDVLADIPADDGLTPSAVFAGASGFSAATAALFEFYSPPVKALIPADGGDAVVAIDLTTGLRVPVRVQVSDYAQSDSVSEPSFVLEVYPRSRWEYGHEILIAITDSLPLMLPEPGLTSRLTVGDDYVPGLIATLTQNGINPLDVRNATRFTVRDRHEVVAPMKTAVEQVRDFDHPVRNLTVDHYAFDSLISAVVEGELQIHNYRQNEGQGLVDFAAEPLAQWVPFRLTLPQAARRGNAPVALYAHGLGEDKEGDLPVVGMNAELGIATFGIDFPNHGGRIEQDGGYVFDILTPGELAKPLGMVVEATIDFASAQRALETALADLDVVGPQMTSRWGGDYVPDGIPDLDVSRLFMEGTSLGGVLGSVYGSVGPDLSGAVYHVTGVGVSGILSQSILWDGAFKNLIPVNASGSEAVVLRSMMQQVLDPGDSVNYIDYFRYPEAGETSRPLMLTMGQGDSVVVNDSTHAAALLLDAPVVGTPLVLFDDVRYEDDYDDDGYGIRQYLPMYNFVPDSWDAYWLQMAADASAHMVMLRPKDQKDQQDFIRRFIFSDL